MAQKRGGKANIPEKETEVPEFTEGITEGLFDLIPEFTEGFTEGWETITEGLTGGFTGDEDWLDNDWPEEYDDDGSSELGAAFNFVGDTMADLSEAFYHISEIIDDLLIDEYDLESDDEL